MSRPDIIRKIGSFLTKVSFSQESEVIYFLVEIRKVLDRDENRNYPVLRFYCDWSVHVSKDRITPEMTAIMKEIFDEIQFQVKSGQRIVEIQAIKRFMYMDELRAEITRFLANYGLPTELIAEEEIWLQFITSIVQILTDQPIIKPCKEIQKFSFMPSRFGCVRGVVLFTEKIGEYGYLEFGNAY